MRSALAALGALLLAACAATGGVTSGLPPSAALGDADVTLVARLLAAADARQSDTAVVREALASGTPYVRRMGALTAGQVRMRPALPTVRALLLDADTSVAATAAYALGLALDTAGVTALAAALDRPVTIASEAAWSLGELGAPARDAVVRALGGGQRANRPAAVTAALLLAASKLRPVPVEAVAPYLDIDPRATPDDEQRVRWAATYAIARPRASAGVRALLRVVDLPDDQSRANVARGLARPAAGDSLADSALAALERLARDPHPHVRINALRSLATYGAPARTAVLVGVRDTDANVRIAAAQGLGTVLDSVSPAWGALWSVDTSFMFRRSVLASAEQAGFQLGELVGWQQDADWRLRASVAEAAGASGRWMRTWALAEPLLRDADGRVRAAALAAIDAFADSAARLPARAAFRAALRDADFYARATALGALARRPAVAELDAVLESWRRAAADSGNDARIAAVRYLAAAWRADSTAFDATLRRTLAGLAVPADPLVRAEAAGVAPLAHWTGTEGARRPAAWYEGIVRTIVLPALEGRPLAADIVTGRGTITLELFGGDAPLTVFNFVTLARGGYYRGVRFHRVVPNFVAQDGDPRGDGNGGPGYAIRDEHNRHRYDRGAVGMALSGPDTGGSQYFITHAPQPHLDGHYTVFGRVTVGYDALDALVQGDRIDEVRIR